MVRRPLLLTLVAAIAVALVAGALSRPGARRVGVVPPAPVPPVAPSAPSPAPAPPASPRIETVTLRRGDTLVRALARSGVEPSVGRSIAGALSDHGVNLKKLSPRDALEVTWDLAGEPVAVRYTPSPWLGYAALASGNGWQVRRSETRPDVRVVAVAGEIVRSLFQAVEDAAESPQLAVDLVAIFESEFDFTADSRAGDRFRLLVEKRYAGDTFVDHGRILAAQYLAASRVLTGVGFERQDRFAYYDPEGRSLKKTFLKSPLDFTRITSGFTYARPHPILGGVRPHLAVDYAAPVGTPVRAVAHGVVTDAGREGGNGISVRLRHAAGYETMYNHLSRLGPGVRRGARVTQRQVIGYVGSTGLSTGPHLDYRVSRNGRFVNPLRETFLPGDPIPAAERGEFLLTARDLVRRLETARPF